MIASISRARGSFSRSGGLKLFRHARVHSAVAKRKDTDLSVIDSEKYVNMEVEVVCSTMARSDALARVTNTLFDRVHIARRVGKKRGRRGSNDCRNSEERVVIKSIATAESLLRSELMAELSGRDRVRTVSIISRG